MVCCVSLQTPASYDQIFFIQIIQFHYMVNCRLIYVEMNIARHFVNTKTHIVPTLYMSHIAELGTVHLILKFVLLPVLNTDANKTCMSLTYSHITRRWGTDKGLPFACGAEVISRTRYYCAQHNTHIQSSNLYFKETCIISFEADN
jgi:hypothetical protein